MCSKSPTTSTAPLSSGSLDEGMSWLRTHCQISQLLAVRKKTHSSTRLGTDCRVKSVCQNLSKLVLLQLFHDFSKDQVKQERRLITAEVKRSQMARGHYRSSHNRIFKVRKIKIAQ
ncbi:unnamed protein product [Caenorhabditis brenneri]